MNFNTMARNANRRSSQRGFTLLELLLVMAILVVLAGLGTVAFTRIGNTSNVRACKVQISELEKTCMAYKLTLQTYPRSLQDLVTLPSGMSQSEWGGPYYDSLPKDPWRNDFTYSRDESQDMVFITSNGPDGTKGTEDDVKSRNSR